MTNLEAIYNDASQPGSLSGLENFYRVLKQKKIKITRQELKKWLESQEVYTRHKPSIKKFPRNQVITRGIDDLWQIDLADVQNIAKENDGFRYLVTCIDVFSKFAWVEPIKNKKAESVLEAFQLIISSSKRKPNFLQSDQGTEFLNKKFKDYLTDIDVGYYYVNSELKASVIERFNRTIKEKIYKYFTLKNTERYVDILDILVKTYNNSYHRSIKTSPNKVNKQNEQQIYQILYKKDSKNKVFNFDIGQTVRITKYKHIFEKGYTPKWTDEIFKVKYQIPRDPVVYKIEDLNKEEIEGVFYEQELQKVTFDENKLVVKKILKKKTDKKKYLVSFKGFPESFNKWISEKEKNEFLHHSS